jgi:hypothetical protein
LEADSLGRAPPMHTPVIDQPDSYRPGDEVQASGLYSVTHDPPHAGIHEVICIKGKIFPPCRGCDHPRFALVRAGCRIEDHEHFMLYVR